MTVWGWEMTSAMTRWLGDVLEMDDEDQRDRGRFWQLPSGGSSRPRLRSVPSPVGRCGRRWPRTRGCLWEWSRSGSRTRGPRWRKCRGGTRWTKTGSPSRRTPRKIKKVRRDWGISTSDVVTFRRTRGGRQWQLLRQRGQYGRRLLLRQSWGRRQSATLRAVPPDTRPQAPGQRRPQGERGVNDV